jgi:tRNA dimethylallyltransferase
MRKILCLVGPTASGKTDAAIEFALRFGGEIVSCDSVQLYRGFDIGSAKPIAEERKDVLHHMIDVADAGDEWSAGRYAREARSVIEGIISTGKPVIITGGTGFYLKALTDGLDGLPPLPDDWEFIPVGLHPPREALEKRIADRSARMLRRGLIEETEALLRSGVSEGSVPMGSIGYRQARAYLAGQLTREETLSEIILRTRQYAKRQRTWFFNQTKAVWLETFLEKDIKMVEKMIFV